jgi:hypothetical protein
MVEREGTGERMKMTTDVKAWAAHRNRTCWECFGRNGRWGTCVECPRAYDGSVFPEFCPNTERYDHQLTIESLVESHKRAIVEAESRLERNGYIAG